MSHDVSSVSPLPLARIHTQDATLYANRDDALEALPRYGRVAEIGVAYGDFSERLCTVLSPELFDAYDLFRLHEVEEIWGQKSAETFRGVSHLAYYKNRFAVQVAGGSIRVFEGDSATQLVKQPDRFYDVIYVDGDHSYSGVRRDTEVATRKIKANGYLVFNDYVMSDHTAHAPYGIVQVVNHLCVNEGWRIHYFALQAAMFCDICLVRRSG